MTGLSLSKQKWKYEGMRNKIETKKNYGEKPCISRLAHLKQDSNFKYIITL